jgi:hypothetical protein
MHPISFVIVLLTLKRIEPIVLRPGAHVAGAL